MIYTVTFNPSLDYVVSVENFTCGGVNRTKTEQIYPGGKGINVSMVLKNLGVMSTALGFLAGFTGDEIERLLKEKGVTADFIRVKEGMSRINVKLRTNKINSDNGNLDNINPDKIISDNLKCEETEINGAGPLIDAEEVERLYRKLEGLKEDDILILAGSIPGSLPSSMYMDIMQYLKNRGIRMIVDATGELLRNVLAFEPFLVKPNHHELGELFGVTLREKEEVIVYAKKLQQMGARNVLVSMAGDGAILVTEENVAYQMDAPKGVVRNSVGAGDSMVAGFVAGYLQKGSFLEAFKLGICAGSASAFSEELATKDEVLDLYEKIDI